MCKMVLLSPSPRQLGKMTPSFQGLSWYRVLQTTAVRLWDFLLSITENQKENRHRLWHSVCRYIDSPIAEAVKHWNMWIEWRVLWSWNDPNLRYPESLSEQLRVANSKQLENMPPFSNLTRDSIESWKRSWFPGYILVYSTYCVPLFKLQPVPVPPPPSPPPLSTSL